MSKKNQEESVRRLSRPIIRGSATSESFSSEIKPSFWKYATAKSIEDLIRVLRKKHRGKKIFKVEDYFFFKDQNFIAPRTQRKSLASDTDIVESPDVNQAINLATVNEEPHKLKNLVSPTESFYTNIEVIKPYINKDVLRITSYGAVSPESTPSSKSIINFSDKDKCSLIRQCIDNASVIFKKIDEAIEENRKLVEKKIKNISEKEDPFNQKRKFKNKSFSPLEALSKIEEINNIIDYKKNNRTDLILPAKYLPGQEVSEQQRKFVKALKDKLEKLQQSYQHWTKWEEENLVQRLYSPRKALRH